MYLLHTRSIVGCTPTARSVLDITRRLALSWLRAVQLPTPRRNSSSAAGSPDLLSIISTGLADVHVTGTAPWDKFCRDKQKAPG